MRDLRIGGVGSRPRRSPGSQVRRRPKILTSELRLSDVAGAGRAGAGYALLGTAFLTSPLLLPIALALLMAGLHGTPLGSALLQHLHLVYIGSVVYCLAALAAAACVLHRPAPGEQRSPALLALPPGPARMPDPRHLEFQRWLLAHGRHAEDTVPVCRPGDSTEVLTGDPAVKIRTKTADCRVHWISRAASTPTDGSASPPPTPC